MDKRNSARTGPKSGDRKLSWGLQILRRKRKRYSELTWTGVVATWREEVKKNPDDARTKEGQLRDSGRDSCPSDRGCARMRCPWVIRCVQGLIDGEGGSRERSMKSHQGVGVWPVCLLEKWEWRGHVFKRGEVMGFSGGRMGWGSATEQ